MADVPDYNRQAAAIPIRAGQVCLVTSSSGKRWVIPKGMIEPGTTAGQIALQEAWEEAGLVGALQREPVGSYLYEKNGEMCHVTVFLMRVQKVAQESEGSSSKIQIGPTSRKAPPPATTASSS